MQVWVQHAMGHDLGGPITCKDGMLILYTVHNYSMGGQKKDRLAGVGLKCML